MARYIDAERMPNDSFWEGLTDKEKAKVIQWLLQSPTADVVEVVRCGKCKHGDVSCHAKTKDGEETIACYCTIKNKVTDVDYYCPSGERRDT